MNKRLLFTFLMTMLSCMAVWSAVGDTFKSGSLTYTILSESPKACAVTRCDNTFTGHLNIPNTVNNYKVTTIGNDGWPCFPEAISGVTIPSNVKTIEAGAFQCCRLTNVSLNNVTSIGDHAFRRCTELTSITIPSTVSELGINPFAGCDNLTSISVANNNANYYSNGNAIYEKNTDKLITGINTTIISNDTKSIGDSAFEFLTGMTGISIPDGVTSIGEYAFSDCTGLSWVYIPSSVNSIGDNAFSCCDNLQSVYVGIVEPINIDNIFYNDNEPRVYENAALYVPDGSKSAYKAATNWKKFNTIYEFSESPYIIFADSRVKSLCVANWDTNGDGELSRSEAAAVTSLGTVFKYNRDIKTFTELEFFTGLQRIDEEAFMYCTSLKTITFPASIKSVGQDAFYECRALTKPITKDVQAWAAINFELDPESSWDNPDWPAYSNPVYFSHKLYTSASETLTTLTLSTTEIGDYAFAYNTVIASVSFPEGMTSIGKGAFRGCTYLQTVTANGGLGTVSNDAFKGCANISTVNTNNLKEWCESSFAIVNEEYYVKAPEGSYAYCYDDYDGSLPITLNRPTIFSNPTSYSKSLKVNGTLISELVLPGDITKIGSGAFVNCTNITKVTFPSNENLNSVGTLAFEGCTNLSRCETNDLSTWATINFWEYRCPNYEGTLVPDEDEPGYYYLSNLTNGYFYSSNPMALTGNLYYNNVLVAGEVSIPEGVTSLGHYSFFNSTDIESITLPSTMTKVSGSAFEGCSSLTEVKSMAATPPTCNTSFPNSVLNGTLYVPYGSKNAYMAANGWKNFNIVEMEPTDVDIPEAIYYLKNVETEKYLKAGNEYGTHAILADEPLPARVSKQQDGSYTIFFPLGSQYQQLLFRDGDGAWVDYDGQESGCPYWTITSAGEGTYHIQTLTTHETYGQSAMPGTYLGNNPQKQGTDNDVDGNIPDEEGMNITWQLIPENPHTEAQATRLQELITQATTLNLNTEEAQALIDDENSTYTVVQLAINALQNLIIENVEKINIVKNSDLEGTDVSCFYSRENCTEDDTVLPATIVDGAGKDGSRGIVITSIDDPSVSWDTQFFLRLPQTLPAGTMYRVTFDYKASQEAFGATEAQAEPSDYIGVGIGEVYYTTGWQHFENTGVITEEQSPADHLMRTIAFKLAEVQTATTYYFDNIVFEVDLQSSKNLITFADAKVKAICVENWDTNGDEELSEAEAAAVTELGGVFKENMEITSFDELCYFTGLTELPEWNSFDGCTALKSITIPANVTSIYGSSFANCSSIEKIRVDHANTKYESSADRNAIIEKETNKLVVGCETIPHGITTIGDAAFWGRWGMQQMVIPETVTTIESNAFAYCASLSTITLPASVNAIGDEAFCDCGVLTSVNCYMETPLAITEDVFSNRANATLFIPAGTRAAYEEADYWKDFGNIVEMVNIVKNSDLEGTDVSCFYSRENYTEDETVLPATIVDGAGKDGSRGIVITSIDNPSAAWDTQFFLRLPQTLPAGTMYHVSFDYKASQEAFGGTEAHAEPSDYIGVGIGEVYYTAEWQHFENTGVITEVQSPADHLMRTIAFKLAEVQTATTYYFDNIVFEVGLQSSKNIITFADAKVKAICVENWDTNGDGELSEAEAAAVTDLGTVFQRNTEITSFNELKYFTGLQFNDQYVSGNTYSGIPGFAFTECTNLKEVALPEVEAIGDAAFMNSGLTAITLPGTVKVIRDGAFSGTEISSFVLPASVTDITYGIIEDCPNLESIVVESGNTVYDSRDNCNAIIKTADNALVIGCASTNIPATVTRLQDYAFQRCKGLDEVVLHDNITSVGRNAFAYSGITSLTIGKGLNSIGESAFWSLDNLSSITIDEKNVIYDSRDNCNAIIRKADNTLIAGCGSTVIPTTVTAIGKEAFWECGNLASISIPATVTTIGDAAFWHCKNLQSVTVEWTEPIKISDAFSTDLTGNKATLYVPAGTKDAYEAANYWKAFGTILEQGTVLTEKDRIFGNDVKVYIGYTADLHINMSNEDTFTAYQFDLELPNGITIAKDEDKKFIITKSDRYSDKSQQVKIEELGNNTFRFICVSMNNGVINGTDGAILSVSLKANAEMAEEMNNGAIKNIILTTSDEKKFCSEDCPFTIETMTLLKGDANGDNDIDVVDIVSMINYIMGRPSEQFILFAADLNDDNEVDVFDVMRELSLALKKKAAARSMARATSGTKEMATVTTTADGMMLEINNPSRFTAFQFDVEVSEGMELTEARLTADAAHHTLRFTQNGQNTYRVIGVSMDNSTLSANGTGLVELSFSKNGRMQISNVIFVTPQETNVCFAVEDGVVTGIASIEDEQAEEIYDLSGRKVDTDRSRLPKGVYIINNKKVVIK